MTEYEKEKYKRHLMITEIGEEGQKKLKTTKILVIGAGGLGSAALLYLNACGIGEIGILDYDKVSLSNLQRQILYSEQDIDNYKVICAEEILKQRNSSTNIKIYNTKLTNLNAISIFNDYDIIIDCCDNLPTRYVINDACIELGKPFIYAALYKFEGQISVFNFKNSTNYRKIFPYNEDKILETKEIGIFSCLPGIVGILQADQAVKMILEKGNILTDKMMIINLLTLNFDIINLSSQ